MHSLTIRENVNEGLLISVFRDQKNLYVKIHFIKVVQKSRGTKLKDPEKNNIFTGEFWTGKTSLKLGLVDGIGNADQVLKTHQA